MYHTFEAAGAGERWVDREKKHTQKKKTAEKGIHVYQVFFFTTLLIPCGKFGSPYLGKATAAARAAVPISNNACSIFVFPKKRIAAKAWDLLRAHRFNRMRLHTWVRGYRKRVCTES